MEEKRESIVKNFNKKAISKAKFKKKNNEKKDIKPLPDLKVSDILTFSNKKDKIVIETVAYFGAMYNYLNTPTFRKRVLEKNRETGEEVYELVEINYRLQDSPSFELIKEQTIKLIIDDLEVEKTLDNLIKFFSRNPFFYKEILNKILENSEGSVKNLLMMK
ncbi:hypothetical protein [Streptobacillus moniliformis]|uniref:hypothetical protein n=1 Tax=Streptobacillus moniliformis TaxID=34105 RepID=UPI0007E4A9D5|nr:hypothetical protein [Streptobacillus moniliformis]